MLNFVCIFGLILASVFEIILTVMLTRKIAQLEKKIIGYNEKLNIIGITTVQISKKIAVSVKNLNKFVRIITNKKLISSMRFIGMAINIAQTIILLKSLNLSKGLKSINYKNIRKLMITEFLRRFLKRMLISHIQV